MTKILINASSNADVVDTEGSGAAGEGDSVAAGSLDSAKILLPHLASAFDRQMQRMTALRAQSYSLLAQILAIYSLVAVGAIAIIGAEFLLATSTKVMLAILTVAYATAFGILVTTIQLSPFKDLRYSQSLAERMLAYNPSEVSGHLVARYVECMETNECRHGNKTKRHEYAFWAYVVSTASFGIFVIIRAAIFLAQSS